ncbi:MAG: hypothetical protein D6677_02780 [Calditrichaeota bacterium]|nr:MAG: hypothetical protein D6677_02780 [Calditrichota bacterium]
MTMCMCIRFLIAGILLLMATSELSGQTSVITTIRADSSLKDVLPYDALNAAGLRTGKVWDSLTVKRAVRTLEQQLADKGWLYARLLPVYENTKGVLWLHGRTGARVRLGNIVVHSDSLPRLWYLEQMVLDSGMVYREKEVEGQIKLWLKALADSGFAFASIEPETVLRMEDAQTKYVRLRFHIHENQRVRLNGVLLRGNSYTRDIVILRETGRVRGRLYRPSEMREIQRRLERLQLFKKVSLPQIRILPDGSYMLEISVEEGQATVFDGVVGYIPQQASSGREGYFTGLFNIRLNNLFGTGRRFGVHWERPEAFSENFWIRYLEPWVAGWPLNAEGGLERTVRDSSYLEWKGDLGLAYRVGEDMQLFGRYARRVVLPDSLAAVRQRLTRYKEDNGQAGFRWDTRDYLLNPRSGIYFENSYGIARKTHWGPGFLLRQDSVRSPEILDNILLRLDLYYELFHKQVVAFKLNARQVSGSRLQLSDLFWFGGSQNVRGYRENQFQSDRVAWLNLEYRLLLGRNTRLYLFNDWAGFHPYQKPDDEVRVIYGYGLGLRMETALGILAVDFGLGQNDGFGDAKLHFGIINRF